ncbi:MAG: hypothetical protein KatS3mg062_1353 [Tepidiforma sp.]|nr:MAG: hypothetical protein KatS3mg062_1353 [Tepidiforma sp.]
MNPWLALLVTLSALNPFAIAASIGPKRPERFALLAAGIVGVAAYAVAAVTANDLLRALSVEPETFDVAAGVILAASGASLLAVGPRPLSAEPQPDGFRSLLVPLVFPLLLAPSPLAVAVLISAREGWELAAVSSGAAVAAALLLVAARIGRSRAAVDGLARLLAALTVIFAAAFAVDGIRSV